MCQGQKDEKKAPRKDWGLDLSLEPWRSCQHKGGRSLSELLSRRPFSGKQTGASGMEGGAAKSGKAVAESSPKGDRTTTQRS